MQFRTMLLATAAAAGLCLSAPALAQSDADSPAAQSDDTTQADAEDKSQEITVTGSRIVRDGYEQPTPVTVARTEDLVAATPTNLPDALNKLPQFQGSSSPTANTQTNANQPTHGNVLNLRAVGGIRTLILQDGVRVPATAFTGTVDTNIIPQLLVERVDVVTAGASAAYGSDAVTGVVNFIIDKNYTGVKGVAQYGISDRGDAANYRLGVAAGFKLGDRGHVLLSYEHFDSNGLLKTDRPGLPLDGAAFGSVPGSTSAPGTAANPYKFYSGGRFNLATFGGLVNTGPFAGTSFFAPGQYRTVNPGTATGTGGFVLGGDYYWIAGNTQLVSPLRTDQAYGRLSYEVADGVTAYVSADYAKSHVEYDVLANAFFFLPIYNGNAFLPAALQTQLGATPSFAFSKAFLDAPLPHADENTESFNIIGGLEGKIGKFRWNASYVYGRSTMDVAQSNLFELVPFAAALDAVRNPANGQIVCNASLSSNPTVAARYANCVPYNPFGNGAYSQAALDYVTGTSTYRAINETHDVSLSVSGDLLDLWAGPLSIAVGGEYREQSLDMTSNADPAVHIDVTGVRGVAATTSRFFLTNLGVAHGRVNVKEGFAEAALPLLVDAPFAKRLDINGAVRYTDYSTSGGVTTWKLGGTWSPISDLTFRITRSRDIRAPTLFDLFAGDQSNIQGQYDPHTGISGSLPTVTGGNPNLRPEVGDTLTFGAVIQPSFFRGFNFAIDFYKLEIRDAIGQLAAGQIIQTCEDSGGTSSVCSLITRPLPFSDRSAANYPKQVRVAGANIAKLEARGFDAEASYHTSIGSGSLSTRLFVSYLDRYRTQQSAADVVVESAGYGGGAGTGLAKWRGTLSVNYANGPFSLFVQEQYIGKIKFGSERLGGVAQTAVYAEPPIKPFLYTDLTVAARLPAFSGKIQIFATINNLFDKAPPFAPGVNGGGAPGLVYPTLTSVYDVIGRRYTTGVRFDF